MNITPRDIALLIVMSLAVVGMSFVFPAMGLTSADTDESDIPEFTVDSSRFDFTGDFPNRPTTPGDGRLYYNSTLQGDSRNQVWLDGDTSGGTELVLLENGTGTGSSNAPEVIVSNWNSGTSTSETYVFNGLDDIQVHNNFSYEIRFVPENVSDTNEPFEYVIKYEIEDTPNSGGFFNYQETAGFIAYIGNVFFWFAIWIVEMAVNLLALLLDSVTLFVSLVSWLSTTYGDVISSANGFASVFVAIPGIILSAILAKFVFVALSLLPTT